VPASPVHIRSYEPRDREAVRQLYTDGLLGGAIAENDTGFDIDDVELAYMRNPGSHFWIAHDGGNEVLGMIGVQQLDAGVGEIRRLRVRMDQRRRGIGSMLLQRALEFCRDQGLLKVTLDTYMEREPALKLFQKFNFRHDKTRETGGKQLLFFYLDLYGSSRSDDDE
jgi:ribosomal protein S18 acetylase RimI-like enzyme